MFEEITKFRNPDPIEIKFNYQMAYVKRHSTDTIYLFNENSCWKFGYILLFITMNE